MATVPWTQAEGAQLEDASAGPILAVRSDLDGGALDVGNEPSAAPVRCTEAGRLLIDEI